MGRDECSFKVRRAIPVSFPVPEMMFHIVVPGTSLLDENSIESLVLEPPPTVEYPLLVGALVVATPVRRRCVSKLSEDRFDGKIIGVKYKIHINFAPQADSWLNPCKVGSMVVPPAQTIGI
jgi:hypothetical protein